MPIYNDQAVAELACAYMIENQPEQHEFIDELARDPAKQRFFDKFREGGRFTHELYATLARAYAERYLVEQPRAYSKRLIEAKRLAEKLELILREGDLFPYEFEQQILYIGVSRLLQLHPTRSPAGALTNEGKKASQRAMRLAIDADLKMREIELTDVEYGELCNLVDPEVSADTCRRERSGLSAPAANPDVLVCLNAALQAYCEGIEAEKSP